MKNRLLTGIMFLLLGTLIALGPQTLFPVCGAHASMHPEAMTPDPGGELLPSDMASAAKMTCYWTGRAEIGLGSLMALLGVLLLILKKRAIRLGLSLALIPTGILIALVPAVLIGVCASMNMKCHLLTLPALVLLGIAAALAAAVNSGYLIIADKGGKASASNTGQNLTAGQSPDPEPPVSL
jgi:hypothetical protein